MLFLNRKKAELKLFSDYLERWEQTNLKKLLTSGTEKRATCQLEGTHQNTHSLTTCLHSRLATPGFPWVYFFLNKGIRGLPQGDKQRTSVVLLSRFAFLAPLTSAPEEFPFPAWSTAGQVWCFSRTRELEGEAASCQFRDLPPNQPEGLYPGSISANREGGGHQERDYWKAVWGLEVEKEPQKGPSRGIPLTRWCGMGRELGTSFSLSLFQIRSTRCRGHGSLAELGWKVTQHSGSVTSYFSEECLAFYGYFNWWQYSLLNILNLAPMFSHVLLHPEHSSCLTAAFSSSSEAAVPLRALLWYFLVWSGQCNANLGRALAHVTGD